MRLQTALGGFPFDNHGGINMRCGGCENVKAKRTLTCASTLQFQAPVAFTTIFFKMNCNGKQHLLKE